MRIPFFGNKHARFVGTMTHNREQQNNNKTVFKGKCIDRGGHGLEDPWECHFTGDKFSILWLNSKFGNEGFELKLN